MRNTKILALPVVLMLGLLSIGVAYACWSETLFISGTVNCGEVDWEIVYNSHIQKDPASPDTNDWTCDDGFRYIDQLTKNVGWTDITYEDTDGDKDYDTLGVTLNNVYPSYYESISFSARCNGSVPIRIQQVNFVVGGNIVATLTKSGYLTLNLGGDGKADVEIYWGNDFGTQLHYDQKATMGFEIHILEDAPQGATLSFTIEIVAVQWNA